MKISQIELRALNRKNAEDKFPPALRDQELPTLIWLWVLESHRHCSLVLNFSAGTCWKSCSSRSVVAQVSWMSHVDRSAAVVVLKKPTFVQQPLRPQGVALLALEEA